MQIVCGGSRSWYAQGVIIAAHALFSTVSSFESMSSAIILLDFVSHVVVESGAGVHAEFSSLLASLCAMGVASDAAKKVLKRSVACILRDGVRLGKFAVCCYGIKVTMMITVECDVCSGCD
jgi:hypothetical protein